MTDVSTPAAAADSGSASLESGAERLSPGAAPPKGPGVPYAGLRLGLLLAALVALGWWSPWTLVVIIAIVVMITLHEFGHYITAKRAGMKVTEFFIFFGPKVWSIQRGETEYGIKCIPAGAYVKIIGMHNLEEVPATDEGRTYRQKSFGRRVSVAVAGSTMHFLLALALIWVALVAVGQPAGTLDPGTQERSWSIRSIVDGSGAAKAGLRDGDRITSIGGDRVETFSDLREMSAKFKGQEVPVTYVRAGQSHTVSVDLAPFYSWYLDRVVPGTGVDAAGLQANDQILSIDGQETRTERDLDDLLASKDGERVTVTYVRGDDDAVRSATFPLSSMVLVGQEGYVGIALERAAEERLDPIKGLVETPQEFANITSISIGALGRFFTPGGISDFASQVGNARNDAASDGAAPETDDAPVIAAPASNETSSTLVTEGAAQSENRMLSIYGLVQIGADVGEVNPAALISLFALINIFIGVFNLVPLLPFDGGHVAIAVYEKIQEKRLHRKRYFTDVAKLLPLTWGVVVVMALLFVSTIYLDIANPLVTR